MPKSREGRSNEATPLLSEGKQPKKEKDLLKNLTKGISDVLKHNCKILKTKKLFKSNLEQGKDADKTWKNFMESFQYNKACEFINSLEEEEPGNGNELYMEISGEMWEAVRKALAGDLNQRAKLQSIPLCIKWATETQSSKDADWVPQRWQRELENLFEKNIQEQLPNLSQSTDKKISLENHLKELSCVISEIMIKLTALPDDLTAIYVKCLHMHLLNVVTTLAKRRLEYKEQVFLYKWTDGKHGELCKLRKGDYDHMMFEKWFFDNGNKIVSTGQEITSITRTVEGLGETLVSSLNSLFWESFLHIVTRYKELVTVKVDRLISGNGILMGLRIVRNTNILRETVKSFKSISQETNIQELLDHCEKKGTEIILSVLSSSLKKAFQMYFKKNISQYENVLTDYHNMLKKQNMEHNKVFNTVIQHRVTVIYIQSFFRYSSKLSHLDPVELFIQGSLKLKDFFADLVSDADQLGKNPLEFMAEMLTATDSKPMQVTTQFFVHEHSDLREEHVIAILDIKGDVSRQAKQEVLFYVQNKKICFGEDRVRYFEEMDTRCYRWKNLLCCPCF
ncbi:uncharacterized protein [Hyperolius riggenbachi]|uniref:uncharacterized protein isoform X2 n=1 Tax=Hyperolius riggenbachi TaxID=752182 RepID=UPI0035A29493